MSWRGFVITRSATDVAIPSSVITRSVSDVAISFYVLSF